MGWLFASYHLTDKLQKHREEEEARLREAREVMERQRRREDEERRKIQERLVVQDERRMASAFGALDLIGGANPPNVVNAQMSFPPPLCF